MPTFDKTGPQGQGPMTGRGMGPCAEGRMGIRRGMGFRRCCGYGRGLGWSAPQTKEEQQKDLENYKKALQEVLEDVDQELSQIGK